MGPIENLRLLCAELVERAKSGHPGAPMGLARFMYILYTEFLVLDLSDVQNPIRDIFVLSNGHACMIQYVMNYFMGLLTFDDLLAFRQLGSRCPGHPERGVSPGIEVSTGPLGQGVAASVGFAVSSKLAFAKLRDNRSAQANHVYCLFGDGCYMEGVAQEAFSLCSTLRLSNITFIYDSNHSTIDGPTALSMNEDPVARFKSLDFTVLECDGDSDSEIRACLAKRDIRPIVVVMRTDIGKDSELEGNCKSHGSPLGPENIKKLRERYNCTSEEFHITPELARAMENGKQRMIREIGKRTADMKYDDPLNKYKEGRDTLEYKSAYESADNSTRKHLHAALNSLETSLRIITGSADLASSVLSKIDAAPDVRDGGDTMAYANFGTREHAMFAVSNGIAAHGVFVPVTGTFLNFATYGYPSIRLGCLDRLRSIYIFSHDSVLLGEDGPTHQPVEVLATMRATPGLVAMRPCDGWEVRAALMIALKETGPVALVVTRQTVKECSSEELSKDVAKGAYFIKRAPEHDIVLYASGSEVQLAVETAAVLEKDDRRVSVVSVVSFELFERQSAQYRESVIDKKARRVGIEALSTFGWDRYSELQIGLDTFGQSAPGPEVYEYCGFTAEHVARRVREFLG